MAAAGLQLDGLRRHGARLAGGSRDSGRHGNSLTASASRCLLCGEAHLIPTRVVLASEFCSQTPDVGVI